MYTSLDSSCLQLTPIVSTSPFVIAPRMAPRPVVSSSYHTADPETSHKLHCATIYREHYKLSNSFSILSLSLLTDKIYIGYTKHGHYY